MSQDLVITSGWEVDHAPAGVRVEVDIIAVGTIRLYLHKLILHTCIHRFCHFLDKLVEELLLVDIFLLVGDLVVPEIERNGLFHLTIGLC
jgi:hypothetical protein